MNEVKVERSATKRQFRATFVLAFLCSCSSGQSPSPDPSVAPGTGDTSADQSQTGPGTGGTTGNTSSTGTNTGVTPTGNTGGSGTNASSAPTEVNTSGGGTNTSVATTGANSGDTSSADATNNQSGPDTDGSATGDSETQSSSGADSANPGDTSGSDGPAVTVLLAGDDVNSNGPLATTVQENVSFQGGGHILVRPSNITTEPNTKHPVAIWGPGGGSSPSEYLMLLTRMASQGFVVVGIRESTGDSALMSAAIDWLEEQNADANSPMYDRLILDRVGVFGHSMGGLSSEATALMDDRVTTALLNNSGAFSHDALVNVTIPTGIIYGETGQERPNAEGDYNNPGNKAPCWLAMMAGGGHGSGPWDGAGANVAWMRWQVGGENFRKDAFLGSGGEYNDRGIWATEFKNWDGWKNWNE